MNADIVGFFQWWLVTHDVWSTLLTPWLSFLWSIYTDNTTRAWLAGIWGVLTALVIGLL